VAGTIDVRIMTLVGFVLDMREVDGDAARALLGRARNLVERLAAPAVDGGHHLGDGRGERGLAVVDVSDGSDVEMYLAHVHSPCCLGPGRSKSKREMRNAKSPSGAKPEGVWTMRRALFRQPVIVSSPPSAHVRPKARRSPVTRATMR